MKMVLQIPWFLMDSEDIQKRKILDIMKDSRIGAYGAIKNSFINFKILLLSENSTDDDSNCELLLGIP